MWKGHKPNIIWIQAKVRYETGCSRGKGAAHNSNDQRKDVYSCFIDNGKVFDRLQHQIWYNPSEWYGSEVCALQTESLLKPESTGRIKERYIQHYTD